MCLLFDVVWMIDLLLWCFDYFGVGFNSVVTLICLFVWCLLVVSLLIVFICVWFGFIVYCGICVWIGFSG